MRRPLDGAVVVITGASSGVGRATAHALAAHRARLVLCSRSATALSEVAREVEARGGTAIVVAGDVADPATSERLARAAEQAFGRIDVWVEAAAQVIVGPYGAASVEELRRLVETNVLGTMLGSRTALAVFDRQGAGTLINVGSVLGVAPNPLVAAYSASKFAVRGLSLALRQGVAGRDVDVCVVLPGPIDTPLFDRAANHTGKRLRAIPPAAAPERVAAAIVACARRPRRQLPVGFLARSAVVLHRISPRLVETLVAQFAARTVTTAQPAPATTGTLFRATMGGKVHGGWRRGALRRRLGEGVGRWQSTRR